MPLQVCGVLLLNSLSIHRVGQVAMMAEEAVLHWEIPSSSVAEEHFHHSRHGWVAPFN